MDCISIFLFTLETVIMFAVTKKENRRGCSIFNIILVAKGQLTRTIIYDK